MSIPVNINGVWRDANSQQVCVNGIWRNTEQWGKVNGVWRRPVSTIRRIDANDIIGFHFIYRLSKLRRHPDYPDMKFNPNIPIVTDIAGKQQVTYDTKPKSLLLRYSNDHPEIEGIYLYEGILYTELTDHSYVSVSDLYDSPTAIDTSDMKIDIHAHTLYESYGPHLTGWNSFFSREHNLPVSDGHHKNIFNLNSYSILPTYRRTDSFDSVALVGIARNTTSREHNMVGSHGVLDQTIESILLNDEPKPFVIEIYD